MKVRHLGWGAMLFVFLLMLVVPVLGAQGASSIAQGFQTEDTNITEGALVSLKPGSANTIQLANPERVNQMIGVVGDKPLIELSDETTTIQVVTSGTTLALVSDINGDIRTGDRITASPIEGVGMKASQTGIIAGTAQANLNETQITERSVTTTDGKQETVKIGMVPIQVDIIFFAGSEQGSSFVPSAVQEIANNIAGETVSPIRVVASSLLLALLVVSIVVLLYSAVKSSIVSIGRNPLSETAVQKSLLQVGLTVVGLLAFTVILIYLILTL